MRVAAGKLDRRLTIQVTSEPMDAAGDVLKADWSDAFKLWAKMKSRGPGMELPTAAGVIRQFDTIFSVRSGPKAESIGPETHRVLWHSRVYEIVGIAPNDERGDLLDLLCAARPDLRGSRGKGAADGAA